MKLLKMTASSGNRDIINHRSDVASSAPPDAALAGDMERQTPEDVLECGPFQMNRDRLLYLLECFSISTSNTDIIERRNEAPRQCGLYISLTSGTNRICDFLARGSVERGDVERLDIDLFEEFLLAATEPYTNVFYEKVLWMEDESRLSILSIIRHDGGMVCWETRRSLLPAEAETTAERISLGKTQDPPIDSRFEREDRARYVNFLAHHRVQ